MTPPYGGNHNPTMAAVLIKTAAIIFYFMKMHIDGEWMLDGGMILFPVDSVVSSGLTHEI